MVPLNIGVALVAALAATPVGQPTDLSHSLNGTWELNVAASDLASDHPKSGYRVTRTVAVEGSALTISDRMENLWLAGHDIPAANVVVKIVTDNVEREGSGLTRMPLFPSKTTTLRAVWQGNNLYLIASGNDLLGNWTTERRMFLSNDGTCLTEIDVDSSSVVESRRTLVFIRKN